MTNQIPIADGHSDLLQELVFREEHGEWNPFRSHWLAELQEGGVVLQVCAVYQAPEMDAGVGFREALRQIASFHSAVESNPEVFVVDSRGDLGKVGAKASVVQEPGTHKIANAFEGELTPPGNGSGADTNRNVHRPR